MLLQLYTSGRILPIYKQIHVIVLNKSDTIKCLSRVLRKRKLSSDSMRYLLSSATVPSRIGIMPESVLVMTSMTFVTRGCLSCSLSVLRVELRSCQKMISAKGPGVWSKRESC